MAFAWAFVVDATKVEHAVDNHAEEFFVVGCALFYAVAPHRVEADEEVAADDCTLGVVEGDDVCEIIVVEVLAVDFKNFVVVNKDVGQFANALTIISGNSAYPFVQQAAG